MHHLIRDAHLMDPFYDKSRISPRTYLWEKKRIDLALVDMSSVPAIHTIGYSGTHKGTDSDHVVGYIDWDQNMISQGLVNRPPIIQRRPVRIEQTDKIKLYLKILILKLVHQNTQQRTINLAQSFI